MTLMINKKSFIRENPQTFLQLHKCEYLLLLSFLYHYAVNWISLCCLNKTAMIKCLSRLWEVVIAIFQHFLTFYRINHQSINKLHIYCKTKYLQIIKVAALHWILVQPITNRNNEIRHQLLSAYNHRHLLLQTASHSTKWSHYEKVNLAWPKLGPTWWMMQHAACSF